jgi:hypothetical protein
MGIGVFHPPCEVVQFSTDVNVAKDAWPGVNPESALMAIVSCQTVQGATGLDRQDLLRRFAVNWTPESFLRDCKPLNLILNAINNRFFSKSANLDL